MSTPLTGVMEACGYRSKAFSTDTSRYHALDAESCQSRAPPSVTPCSLGSRHPLQMPVPSFVSAPDASAQSPHADRLFLAQGPIPAMVQSHGHGSESVCLVETLIAPGRSSLSLYGPRPLWRVPRGFFRPQPLVWARCMSFELAAQTFRANPGTPAFAVSCLAISSRPQKRQWMCDSGRYGKPTPCTAPPPPAL